MLGSYLTSAFPAGCGERTKLVEQVRSKSRSIGTMTAPLKWLAANSARFGERGCYPSANNKDSVEIQGK